MGGLLTIDRVRADCRVVGSRDAAPAVGDRASRALRDHLPRTLQTGFAQALDREDDSVWIIRRVDVAMAAAAESPPDQLASLMARALGFALAEALRGDGDGVNAIRFKTPAAYLAQFVRDVAAGAASGRWFYRPFAGLNALPRSAAIRTALTATPTHGRAALAALDDHALAAVAAAVAPADEARVLDAWDAEADSASTDDDVFAAAWVGFTRAAALGVERGRVLFAVIRADRPAAPRALAHAVRLIDRAHRAATAALPSLIHVDRGHTREPENDHRTIAIPEIAALPPPIARAVIEEVRRRVEARQTPVVSAEVHATRFGGIFLLLRDIDSLPWAAWTKDWPTVPQVAPDALMRWLTAIACVGRLSAVAAIDDAVIRDLFEIPPDVTAPEIVRWLRLVGPRRRRALEEDLIGEAGPLAVTVTDWRWLTLPQVPPRWRCVVATAARIVLGRFARRIPGFAESTPRHLWRNFLAFDAAIEDEDTRVVVRCGRPPLHLLLALTGMTRGLAAGRDRRHRPILLFPRE